MTFPWSHSRPAAALRTQELCHSSQCSLYIDLFLDFTALASAPKVMESEGGKERQRVPQSPRV